jgi:hypothetical protein
MVGVHTAGTFGLSLSPIMLANFLCLIHPATPSDVLTATAYPFGSVANVGEVKPTAIVCDCYHLLAATVCGVGSAVLIAM